jgi:hypothetical protein
MYRFMGTGLAVILVARIATGVPSEVAAEDTVATLIGAGDIASCGYMTDSQTAGLLDAEWGTVLALGDNAYPKGSAAQYRNCYDPTWGRHLRRTRPVPGNHEYKTPDASGYFGYFGTRAGTPGRGWYAYNKGAWRIYALNSNCSEVGGCWVGSRQQRWLEADLAAHPRACILAYWHHPYFSSGFHGNATEVRGLWKTLQAAGAEVVLNGHDHDYERFAPQTWQGVANPAGGIREFVVGTGGTALRPFETIQPNSEVRSASAHGVLRLRLYDGRYRWRFISTDGAFLDAGSGSCH